MKFKPPITIEVVILLSIAIMVMGWLFLGLYRHREYGDLHLFIKPRPTFKLFFYAPVGESDTTLEQLSPMERYEEMMYKEYVEGVKL